MDLQGLRDDQDREERGERGERGAGHLLILTHSRAAPSIYLPLSPHITTANWFQHPLHHRLSYSPKWNQDGFRENYNFKILFYKNNFVTTIQFVHVSRSNFK